MSCRADGLAAFGDDDDDLILALVRTIVATEEDADSVESVFAQAQEVAAEAGERHQSLFSCAEFMAGEPEEPPRKRGDAAPMLSLLEWALERERESELAGTGRQGASRVACMCGIPAF